MTPRSYNKKKRILKSDVINWYRMFHKNVSTWKLLITLLIFIGGVWAYKIRKAIRSSTLCVTIKLINVILTKLHGSEVCPKK